MTRTLLFSKKLRSTLFASALMLTSATLFAQVKVGANSETIGANSNLEVEATSGSKTVITKDAGKLIVDGNAQIKTLPVAANTDRVVSADASGNLTARPNFSIVPLTLLDNRYDETQVQITGVNAVRSGNVVCLEGNIYSKATLAPNANGNEFLIALIPAGYRPRIQTHLFGGDYGPQHSDAWEIYNAVVYPSGVVSFYIPDASFTINHLVSVNGICYITN